MEDRRIGNLLSAMFTLALSAAFLLSLANPAVMGKDGARSLLIIITMEFFIVHSSMLLGAIVLVARKKKQGLVLLLAFSLIYALFFVSYSYVFDEWWPAVLFLAMMLSRISQILVGQKIDAEEQRTNLFFWALSMGLYVASVGGAVLLIPKGHGFYTGMPWTNPQAMLVAGFLYYLLLGIAILLRMRILMLLKHEKAINRLHRYY